MLKGSIYKLITVVVISVMLIGATVYAVSNYHPQKPEEKPVQQILIDESFKTNHYYAEHYISIDNIVFSETFIKDNDLNNINCGLKYSNGLIPFENSEIVLENKSCSEIKNNDLIIDDSKNFGEVDKHPERNVVEVMKKQGDTVRLFFSIDGSDKDYYIIDIPSEKVSYSVIDNILRYEMNGDLIVNSYEDISFISDDGLVFKSAWFALMLDDLLILKTLYNLHPENYWINGMFSGCIYVFLTIFFQLYWNRYPILF